MAAQFLGFLVLFVLVFGGLVAALAKFTLKGRIDSKVEGRMNIERFNEALNIDNDEANVEEMPFVCSNTQLTDAS